MGNKREMGNKRKNEYKGEMGNKREMQNKWD